MGDFISKRVDENKVVPKILARLKYVNKQITFKFIKSSMYLFYKSTIYNTYLINLKIEFSLI